MVTGDEDVGGLTGAQHEDFGGEGFDVGGVGAHHRHLMVGDGEEKGLVQGGVHHAEEVGLAGVYWNNDCLCIHMNHKLS